MVDINKINNKYLFIDMSGRNIYISHMDSITSLAKSTEAMTQILQMAQQQTTELNEKLIDMNVQNLVNIAEVTGLGNNVDVLA